MTNQPGCRPIVHLHVEVLRRPVDSAQYTSIRYSDRLAEMNVSAAVGSRGDSYDNAMAESLNGTFKAELIKLHGPWRTRDATEIAIIEWIDWYNAVRLPTARSVTSHPPSTKPTWYRHNPAATAALTT